VRANFTPERKHRQQTVCASYERRHPDSLFKNKYLKKLRAQSTQLERKQKTGMNMRFSCYTRCVILHSSLMRERGSHHGFRTHCKNEGKKNDACMVCDVVFVDGLVNGMAVLQRRAARKVKLMYNK